MKFFNATATVEPEEMVTSSGNTRLKGIVKVNVLYEDAADTSSDSNKKSVATGMLNLPFHTMSSLILLTLWMTWNVTRNIQSQDTQCE